MLFSISADACIPENTGREIKKAFSEVGVPIKGSATLRSFHWTVLQICSADPLPPVEGLARAWAWPLLQLISPPAATIAVFLPGERGVLPIMAGSVVQANQILNFLKGIFTGTSKFAGTVRKPPGTHASGIISDRISLRNRVDIEVRPAPFRTIRGITARGNC